MSEHDAPMDEPDSEDFVVSQDGEYPDDEPETSDEERTFDEEPDPVVPDPERPVILDSPDGSAEPSTSD